MREERPQQSERDPAPHAPAARAARLASRSSGPAAIAIRHLRRRRIAVACFFILVFYALLMLISYVRMPGTWVEMVEREDGAVVEVEHDREFIGERFEELATRRLVDEDGNPLDYCRPSLSGPIRYDELQRAWVEREGHWETTPSKEGTPASNFHFIFGTDIQGRSVLWRTLYSCRMSLTVALGASLLAIFIGTSLGAVAGYFGGLLDVIITWLFTTVASIPRILLILALAYSLRGRMFDFFGILSEAVELTGTPMLILAMGLTTWVSLCRLIRGEMMKLKEMDYESAARAIGMSRPRILVRHLLPNAMYLVIIQFSLIFPLFIHLEVILSYLGLGATEGVSWGQMIEASLLEMMKSPIVWWQLTAATIAVFGVSLALNLFGDALRDALDPKLQAND